MKLSAITSVFFVIFGVITSLIYMKQRGAFITGSEKVLLFGLLWVAAAIIVGSSWFLQTWLHSRRSAFEETKSPALGFGLMGLGMLFMFGSLGVFAYTAPSYARAKSLADSNPEVAQDIWCYTATERKRTFRSCFLSSLGAQRVAKSIKGNADAKASFKALLLDYAKSANPQSIKPSDMTSLELVHETIGPDPKVAAALDAYYLKTINRYPNLRASALTNWSARKTRPVAYNEQLQAYDQSNHDNTIALLRKKGLKDGSLDKALLITKSMNKEARGPKYAGVLLASQPRYQATNIAMRVLSKTVTEMPPLLRQSKAYTTRALAERGHQVISVHKHLSVVFDKNHRPIMALRDRGAKIVGAMTLLPPNNANSWTPETLDDWAAMLTKEAAPLAQSPTPQTTDTTEAPKTEPKQLANKDVKSTKIKKKAPKDKAKKEKATEEAAEDKPKHIMRASYRMDTLWTQDNTIGRAVLGRYPIEFRHLTTSWLANHMSVDEQFDDMLKAKLKKEGYKGKTYDTYYKKNKKAFRTDYYSNSYRTGGVYIFPIVTPRTPSYGRSSYRSSGYRSTSRSSGYRSSGRSYRSGSYRSSGYRSSGYRSGKN